MSELAKTARRAMREKANRLGGGLNDPHKKIDASSWEPGPALNADRKTGARPIRARIYKAGGKIQGDRAPRHAGKMPRGGYADGGAIGRKPTVYEALRTKLGREPTHQEQKDDVKRILTEGLQDRAEQGKLSWQRKRRASGGSLSIYDTADANKRELGSFHDGGYKRGGAPKAGQNMAEMKAMVHKHEKHDHKGEPLTKLKRGGGANWIAGAIKHPGALHKELGVAEGKKIPAKKLEKAEHSDNPKLAKRARLAETLKGLHKADGGPVGSTKEKPIPGGPNKYPSLDSYKKIAKKMIEENNKKPEPYAHGGRAKGKTNINIVIAQPRGEQQMPQPMQGPTRPPVVMPPPSSPPPMMPPPAGAMPPPGGSPPMMRKHGGRTMGSLPYPIKDGSASGEGRLEKTRAAEKHYVRA